MKKKIILTGLFLGVVAIILDAFGSHFLEKYLTPRQMAPFIIGVRYQMYHALFLFFLSTQKELSIRTLRIAFNFIISGVILFSGSLYLLTTNNLTFFNFKIIGFATPLGGLLLIVAWSYLFFSILKQKS